MRSILAGASLAFTFLFATAESAFGQCNEITANGPNTNATSCSCASVGQTDCDLLPDVMISWQAMQNEQYYSGNGGPSEYGQTGTNAARLRVSGGTPNVGMGPLEVRGVRADGYRKFICGPVVDSVYSPSANNINFTCGNGYTAKQILFQRIYHKNGNTMSFSEYERGTMTYHPTHQHYHVNGWTTMTLRIQQPGVSDARQWPIVGTGGKLGFCLTNLFTCSSAPGYCRSSHLYNQGTTITNTAFGGNYALGSEPGCSDDVQSIVVGKGDVYEENLDGMWINLMPGLCNNASNAYWIVAEVDPNNDFIESNEANNWTSLPVTLANQTVGPVTGQANIFCSGNTVLGPGQTRTLTASPGTAYAWSTGATARSITIGSAGTYSCTVTCPCGTLSTPSLTITALNAPVAPTGTDDTINGPGSATLGATGSDVHWFDAQSGGTEIGTGTSFSTPVLQGTTSYWAEDRNTFAAQEITVGRANNTTQGAYLSEKQWMFFDVTTPFKLKSFKVRANSTAQRHFVLVDRLGTLIAEKYIEIPTGLSTIEVNWDVPVGSQHRITAYDDNTEVSRNLWYNNAGVSYPYPIGTFGSITGSSNGPGNYYYLYDWVVSSEGTVATSARTQVTATVVNQVSLALTVKLEGPLDQGSGIMNDPLRTAGLIPATEPYTGLGFTQAAGGGGESFVPSVLTVAGNNAIVDWVRVELRAQPSPNVVVATRQALVQRDGDVVATDGLSPIQLGVGAGNYYVAVRHRNHLGAMTATAIALGPAPTTIDLSAPATATWGTNARKTIGSITALWTGNARQDAELKYTGSNNDRDPILTVVGSTTPTNTVAGYQGVDVNMDGVIKYTGSGNDRDPILVNVGSTTPNNVRSEQLP